MFTIFIVIIIIFACFVLKCSQILAGQESASKIYFYQLGLSLPAIVF